MDKKFFLAANSAEGFYSVFDKCYSAVDGWRAYIIKGGPGTGKSSLMRKLTKIAQEKNIPYELCPCSSDPSSLDAVIFPSLKKVVLDGTAPHTVDPKYPAVCETIINTGEFWDLGKVWSKRDDIIKLTDKNSALHKIASQYIKAAGGITKTNFSFALSATDIEKCVDFAVKLATKNIPLTTHTSKKWTRFLGGITPNGVLHYTDTVSAFQNKILIDDNFGAAASIILSTLSDIALSRGYEIIVIKNALLPSDITDAVIIPKLCLAVCREYEGVKYDSPVRRIHYERFTDGEILNKNRQKLNFNKKTAEHLLSSAVDTLKSAKSVHDKLEGYYVDAMNFDVLNAYTDKLILEFFK